MALRTLIIDDEPIALEKLKKYVDKVPFLELAAACENGFDAIDCISSSEGGIDLIITDINMPDLNGMEFVKSLKEAPMVIFTTAYAQYAVDSYKVSAVDYLLKPYGFADFHQAVSKAWELYEARARQAAAGEIAVQPGGGTPSSLFIKVDYRYVRVALSDIRYIKGYGEYLQVYVVGKNSPLLTLSSFASIREKLSDSFLQVHRSFIVNMDHVEQIERGRVVMDADTYIPVGDSYRPAFQQFLASRSVGKAGK